MTTQGFCCHVSNIKIYTHVRTGFNNSALFFLSCFLTNNLIWKTFSFNRNLNVSWLKLPNNHDRLCFRLSLFNVHVEEINSSAKKGWRYKTYDEKQLNCSWSNMSHLHSAHLQRNQSHLLIFSTSVSSVSVFLSNIIWYLIQNTLIAQVCVYGHFS